MRRRLLAAAALSLLWRSDPRTWSAGRCPTAALTGLHCPGCGSTRGLHALLHGDVAAAWRFNPAMVLVLPLAAWWMAFETSMLVRGRPLRWPRAQPRPVVFHLTAAILMLWWIARNVAPDVLAPPGG